MKFRVVNQSFGYTSCDPGPRLFKKGDEVHELEDKYLVDNYIQDHIREGNIQIIEEEPVVKFTRKKKEKE
jgi:hypothetical protein